MSQEGAEQLKEVKIAAAPNEPVAVAGGGGGSDNAEEELASSPMAVTLGLDLEDVTIPWDHYVEKTSNCGACNFATRPYFWRRVQWALQFTFVACLPAAVLAFHPDVASQFEVTSMFLPFCVVCTKPFVGESFNNLIDTCKGFLGVIITLSLFVGINVNTHWAAWGAVYAIVVFLVSLLTEGGVTINILLLFTIGMMVHASGNHHLGWQYGLYLVRDSLVGVALGVFACVFPAPRTNFGVAKEVLENAYRDYGQVLVGLSDALTAPAGSRPSKLILIRFKRDGVKDLLATAHEHIANAWYEPFVGEQVNKLEGRCRLLNAMMISTEALIDCVEEFGENRNWVAYRTKRFDEGKMNMSLEEGKGSDSDGGVLRCFEEKFENGFEMLSAVMAQELGAIWKLKDSGDNNKNDPTELTPAQRRAAGSKSLDKFLEHTNRTFLVALNSACFQILDLQAADSASNDSDKPLGRLDDTIHHRHALGRTPIPLTLDSKHRFPRVKLGYYLFNMSQIARMMIQYQEPEEWTTGARFKCCFVSPLNALKGVGAQMKELFVERRDDRVEKVIDSVKKSVAMTVMAAVVLAIDSPEKVFSGPAVIAFVHRDDAGQTMRGSAEQLFGSIFGSVFGYLLASLGSDPVALGGWVLIVAIVTGFVRGSKSYGFVAFYCQFSAFGSIRPDLSAEVSLRMVQQNVAAITLYFILVCFVWPHMPSEKLQRETRSGLLSIKAWIAHMKLSILADQQEDAQKACEAAATSGGDAAVCQAASLVMVASAPSGGNLDDMDDVNGAPATTIMLSMAEIEERKKRLEVLKNNLPMHIAHQAQALGGASLEPALSDKDFPTHHIERLIECQTSVYAVLTALDGAGRTYRATDSAIETANNNVVLMELTPILIQVTTTAIQLLDRMVATMDGTLAPHDSLLSKTCMLLDRHQAALEKAEAEATHKLIAGLRAEGKDFKGDVSIPPAVLTEIQSTYSLVATLKACYHTFLMTQQALKRQIS